MEDTSKTGTSKDGTDKHRNFLDRVGYIIVASAVFLMLVIITSWILPTFQRERIYSITYSIDTTGSGVPIDSFKVDAEKSLKAIKVEVTKLATLKKEIQKLKEDEIVNTKLFTSIAGIIVALAGFFGFKSLASIKESIIEDVKATATSTAREEARHVATMEATEFLQNKAETVFSDRLYKSIDTVRETFKADEQGIADDLTQLQKRVTDLESGKMKDFTIGIDNSDYIDIDDDTTGTNEDPFNT